MNFKPPVTGVLLAAGLAVAATPVSALDGADIAQRLVGTWRSAAINMPAPDGTRAFVRSTAIFTPTRERLIVEAFADAELEQPLFVYDSEGPFEILGPWPAIEGAYAANLRNDRSEVTILVDAPEIWAAINLAACPLRVGVAVDIASCSDGPPFQVTDCVDMEALHLGDDGATLRFGGGGVNRCEERPTVLGDVAFERQ